MDHFAGSGRGRGLLGGKKIVDPTVEMGSRMDAERSCQGLDAYLVG